MRMTAMLILLSTMPATAQQPSRGRDGLQMGFYCGRATLYPYADVYCPRDDCTGDCRGVFMFNSKSAPLPDREKSCVWADTNNDQVKWYQWRPRAIEGKQQEYLGPRVCFLEDRGAAKDLNALER